MDTRTNFECNFPEGDIAMDTPLDLFGIDGEVHHRCFNFPSHVFATDPISSFYEPDMTVVTQDQEMAYSTQLFCEFPFLDRTMQDKLGVRTNGDGYTMPEIMTNYNDILSLAPSATISGHYSGTVNYCASPSLLQSQIGFASPMSPFNITEQPVVDGNLGPNLCNTPQIIPRSPVERESVGIQIGRNRGDGKVKTYRRDLAKRRKRIAKPVSCHLCFHTVDSQKDLSRHHVVWHKDYAVSIGLNVEPIPCSIPGCQKKYTRLDNLTRHLGNKHGRMRQ